MGMRKGMIAGLAAAFAVAAWSSNAHAVAACGDLNNNGSVTTGDAALLLQVAVGSNPGTTLCGGSGAAQCGDIRADGGVAIGDVVLLLGHALGNPVPFYCTGSGPKIAAGTTISSNVTNNQEWVGPGAENCCACDASNTIFVQGTVFVQPGVTLTVNKGTCIKEQKRASVLDPPSVLVVQPGAQILAVGEATCPIVVTSDQPVGSRLPGDHGGLVLNGHAPVNCPGGTCQAEGLASDPFGGNSPNDSSGILKFVRIEFSGIEVSTDNELNIFTQNGVGRSTSIDHIQGNVGFDDCIEWFGGTVNEKFLVGSGCGDDIFDWQLATSGAYQYGLGIDRQTFLQAGNGNNGFEGDNNENGFDFLPRSDPKFCNFTVIGTRGQGGTITGGSGALLRRGTAGKIANSLLMNFNTGGLRLADDATAAQACVNSTTLKTSGSFVVVENSLVYNNGAAGGTQVTDVLTTPNCTGNQWYDLLVAQRGVLPTRGSGTGADPLIDATYPTNPASGQFVPPAGSPLATSPAADCKTLDTSLDTTNYLGAFQPAGANWLFPVPGSCWISFAQN